MPDDVAPELLVERRDAVALVTLNRPAVRNALNGSLRASLWREMSALDADDEIAAVVLTGADPAFCAGIDLKELGSTSGGLSERGELAITGGARPIPAMSKPVIGAVGGVAITGGFELALACDFLVASERARFADTHVRVGIQPGWGLTVHLAQSIGLRRARELSFTGNFLDAQTALEWGLVNHVVGHAELVPTALALAADIAGNDRAGVARIRQTYQDGSLGTAADAFAIEGRVSQGWLANVAGADVEARRAAVVERGRDQLG